MALVRSLIAKSVEKINAGDPKIIGLNFIYSETEENSGFRELKILTDIMEKQGNKIRAVSCHDRGDESSG